MACFPVVNLCEYRHAQNCVCVCVCVCVLEGGGGGLCLRVLYYPCVF